MSKLQFYFTENSFMLDKTVETSGELDGWQQKFEDDKYMALYEIGLYGSSLESDVVGKYLSKVTDAFFEALRSMPDIELYREMVVITLTEDERNGLLDMLPLALGSEYVDENWIIGQMQQLNRIFSDQISSYSGTVAMYLMEHNEHLKVVERVFFHLVESGNEDFPFAFLATYATRNEDGKIKHVPLQYALTEYKAERQKLLELLSCLNKVAEVSPIIHNFMVSGELFHPLRLTADEAYEFLKSVEGIEKQGIVCRIPNWWRKKNQSVCLTVALGEEKPSYVGFDAILKTTPKLTVNGVPLTKNEIRDLLKQTDGLAFLKGKWIEVNHARLSQLLEQMEHEEAEVTLLQALRQDVKSISEEENADVGRVVTNGAWLAKLLKDMRTPAQIRKKAVPKTFHATLRPYQKSGYTWLSYMEKLGFGACLADDMGLGKTVQVLAYLEQLRQREKDARVLLVVPASLLGNWQKESEKFVPGMKVTILHGASAKVLGEQLLEDTSFLIVTTYGMASRIDALAQIDWDCLILDEAQAIKNPLTKQTKRIKSLHSRMKICMTGTPIENDLSNLWSLFDFLNKGLLGTSKEFREYCKRLNDRPEGYAKLKNMITPFMLRRVKTDKNIIADLPEKLEKVDYVDISKKQRVLYYRYVKRMEAKIEKSDGISRRGIVLASLTKLKQICNHPDQYLGQEEFDIRDSGKFEMLKELCETIYQKRERVLVFTQFKEITPYLDDFLASIFHARGYVIHGGVSVKERTHIVEEFQSERYVPYIVLSVRAGGTGLNLTKANHVVHFDRWWNPAVENQATDRAYRIGQQKNVMVHKLVCRGTIEEKIDELICSKVDLAQNVIGSGGENWITEMSNEELFKIMRLD